jgi:MFS family permease
MFAATMGIGVVAPVLPVHARSLGATGPQVALTFSAFAATQVLISPFAGRLGDRFGRKPFILLGLATYLVAAIGWLLTTDIWVAITLRVLSGVGSALVFSLASAYIGDLTPRGHEGRYMGVYGLFDFLGFGAGPLVSGLLRDQWGFDAVFMFMAALIAAALLVIVVLLPVRVTRVTVDRGGDTAGEPDAADPPVVAPWSEVLRHPVLQGLFAVGLGYSVAFGAGFSFLAVYLESEIRATATMVGVVLAGQEFTAGLLQPVFGRVADRVSRRLMILVGVVMVSAGYATFAVTNEYLPLALAFTLGAGLGSAIQGVASRALAVEVGRELGMATVMSLNSMSFGLGVLVGSLGGGVLADVWGERSVFIAAAGALLLSAAIFQALTARRALSAVRPASVPVKG